MALPVVNEPLFRCSQSHARRELDIRSLHSFPIPRIVTAVRCADRFAPPPSIRAPPAEPRYGAADTRRGTTSKVSIFVNFTCPPTDHDITVPNRPRSLFSHSCSDSHLSHQTCTLVDLAAPTPAAPALAATAPSAPALPATRSREACLSTRHKASHHPSYTTKSIHDFSGTQC